MRPVRAVLVASFALGAFVGCAGAERDDPEPEPWHLEEVGRLGSLEDEGPALSQVAGLALTDSTVLVLESAPPRVAVFDDDGRWLRDIGGPGDGPGEFRAPLEIGVLNGDLWVGDLNGARLETFTSAGVPLASHRWSIPRDSLGDLAVPTALLSDGSVLAAPRRVLSPNVRYRPHYRTTPGGEILAVLYRQEVAEGDVFVVQLPGNRLSVGLHPMRESPVVDILPDGAGLLVVEQRQAERPGVDTFRVQVIAPDGGRTADFGVPYTPVPADGWLDGFTARMEQDMLRFGPVDRELVAAVRQNISPRDFYPPVSGAVAGSDGTIWIRREAFIAADSVRWQVFDATGRELGRLSAPTDVELLHASREEVWAVQPGDLDVPFVVRLRVQTGRTR